MSTASISKSAIAVAFCLLAISGCDSGIRSQSVTPGQANLESSLDRYLAKADVLRVKADEARGRIWALHGDGVDLYDAGSDAKLRSFSLPEWLWAGAFHSCPPDLAIGPGGEVIVSSNVVPVLWRIDAITFQVTRHELVADERAGKDVGFSGMVYSAQQGAFLAVNGLDGSLWRIDASLTRAQNIPLSEPVLRACALSVKSPVKSRMGAFCVQTEGRDWIVHLAPDYRSGYAQPASCSPRELAPTAQLQTSKTSF